MCQYLSIFFVLICTILHFNSIVTTSNETYVKNETIIEVQQQHNNIDYIKVDDYIPDFIRIKFDSLYNNQTSSHDHESPSHKKSNNKSKDSNYNNINNHTNNEDSNVNNKNDIDMKTKHVGNDDNQYDDLLRSSSRSNKDGGSNNNDADDSRYYNNDGNKKLHDDENNNTKTENKRRKSDHKYDSNTNSDTAKSKDNHNESIQNNEESIQDNKNNNNNNNNYNNNIDDNDDDDKKFKSTKSNDRVDIDYEEELRIKQHTETLRLRKIREREIEGEKAVKRTIQAGSNEQCDWRSEPLAIIKGIVVGIVLKCMVG